METVTDPGLSISMLFVEDDETVLELQASILAVKFPGASIHKASNGEEGLELFKRYKPDIVITDINMSEMCGLQMSVKIRELKADTKFIAITGKSENLVQQDTDGKEFEFEHIIVKPVILSELFAVVTRCIVEIEQKTSLR